MELAIIMSYPTSASEVISYTMAMPIKTLELHYMICPDVFFLNNFMLFSFFINEPTYATTIMQTAFCRKHKF